MAEWPEGSGATALAAAASRRAFSPAQGGVEQLGARLADQDGQQQMGQQEGSGQRRLLARRNPDPDQGFEAFEGQLDTPSQAIEPGNIVSRG